jgi:hypothetical protein
MKECDAGPNSLRALSLAMKHRKRLAKKRREEKFPEAQETTIRALLQDTDMLLKPAVTLTSVRNQTEFMQTIK